jgi:hypothetical protein
VLKRVRERERDCVLKRVREREIVCLKEGERYIGDIINMAVFLMKLAVNN